ncbi:MAG: hypothetical protein HYU25_02390 [Candidatus Rokubacteria bacterium]|nr:hypothetical protein [Candidatus Rokubacteria bacterium]
MHRALLSVLVAALVVVAVAGQALAFQCPKLAAQINAAVGNRADATAADAKEKVQTVMQLHGGGKHADAEKLAKEVIEKLK